MDSEISCDDLAVLMDSAELYAVFDVRERGEYNDAQIPGTTSLPRSQIEFRIPDLVPDPSVKVVLYDEGGERASLAASTLERLGYDHVLILAGGLAAWRDARRNTVSGVNVPSKAFGEKVHHERTVPDVTPEELKTIREQSPDVLILDVRTPEEYGRFCIPGGINVPGGDLILWADHLRQQPDRPVIVNCAGRTRSIIGTAAFRRLGLNNVRALRNGTMGWVLAGYELERQPNRTGRQPSVESRRGAVALAQKIADEESVAWISPAELSRMAGSMAGMHYIVDVRSEDEYASGHVPGSLNVPGGQAVQRADDFIAVRNAPIVFVSNESARAVMAAYWYRQMGFPKVSVLQGGLRAWSESEGHRETGAHDSKPLGFDYAVASVRWIDPPAARQRIAGEPVMVLDLSTSIEFEAAHIPGARWISRGWIELKWPEECPDRNQAIILMCPDGRQSILAAATLEEMGYKDVAILRGGASAWTAAGFPTAQGMDGCLVEPNDVVLSPSIRGNKEDMQRYLDWELTLRK